MVEGKEVKYDCENLRYIISRRLVCSKGVRLTLTKDGGVDSRYLLIGITPKACEGCILYRKGTLLCA